MGDPVEIAELTDQVGQRAHLAAVESLPSIVSQHHDAEIAAVRLPAGMRPLVPSIAAFPDVSRAVDDIVISDVGPLFLLLVVPLDATNVRRRVTMRVGPERIPSAVMNREAADLAHPLDPGRLWLSSVPVLAAEDPDVQGAR